MGKMQSVSSESFQNGESVSTAATALPPVTPLPWREVVLLSSFQLVMAALYMTPPRFSLTTILLNPYAIYPLTRKVDALLARIIHITQALQMTILLPILVFMVPSYGILGDHPEDLGRYVGFMAALYYLGQFATSMMWGMISDRTGRRMWLVFGNLVTMVTAVALGLCRNYWAACAVRLANGLLNCTLLITKACLAESCDRTNISNGFAILNTMWGVGTIVGSMLGGLLADPCTLYHLDPCPALLADYPFMLPFMAVGVLSLLATFCSCCLPERKTGGRGGEYAQLGVAEDYEMEGLRGGDYSREAVVKKEWVEEGVGRVQVYSIDDEEEDDGVPFGAVRETHQYKTARMSGQETKLEGAKASFWSMVSNRDVLLVTALYALMGFMAIYGEELFPIFAAAPEAQGGLHFDSPTLGTMNGVGGATTIIYTLFVYPTLGRMFGSLLCMRVSILVAIPLYLAIPACSLIFPHGALFWSVLTLLFVLKSVVLATAFTAMMVLVCNASTPDTLGAVNGLGQSTSMLFRTFAPALGGTLWTMSITLTIPAHQFLSWLALVAATLATFGIAMCLRPELDKPRDSDSYS